MKIIHVPESWVNPLNEYMQWLRVSDAAATTIKLRNYHLRRFATHVNKPPFTVKPHDLLDYLDRGNWSDSYRRSLRTTMRSFYRWARKQHYIPKSPARKIPKISVPPGSPRPAPEASVRIGLDTPDQRSRLMVRLAAEAGLRCCEIAVVNRDDYIPDGDDGPQLLVHGKGGKTRIVPISPGIALAIERSDDYLFPGQIDGHLSASYVSKLLSHALPDHVTGHRLRHRFASVAYAGTGDIRAVQELLGHSSVATTQVYTAVPAGAKRQGVMAAIV